MKKRNLFIAFLSVMAISAAAAGCGAKTTQAETSTSSAAETNAETMEETSKAPASESEQAEQVVTPGIFKSEETIAENERQATFTDEHGNDFIANISENTQVPDELKAGETYLISHSDMMTMSLPGIYPQVSKIEVSDTKLEIPEDAAAQAPAAN